MQINNSVVDAIAILEKENFANPWDRAGIIESLERDYNHILIIRPAMYHGIIREERISDIRELLETDIVELGGYLIWNDIAGESELLRIAISNKYKRMGLGSALMERYIELAGKTCDRFLLEVRAGNSSAIRLYERYNYNKIAIRKNYYNSPVEDALIFERKK